jgi:hypothetical protein
VRSWPVETIRRLFAEHPEKGVEFTYDRIFSDALLTHFKDFHIQKYEEGVWLGDWVGPPAELVRMIARKK